MTNKIRLLNYLYRVFFQWTGCCQWSWNNTTFRHWYRRKSIALVLLCSNNILKLLFKFSVEKWGRNFKLKLLETVYTLLEDYERMATLVLGNFNNSLKSIGILRHHCCFGMHVDISLVSWHAGLPLEGRTVASHPITLFNLSPCNEITSKYSWW